MIRYGMVNLDTNVIHVAEDLNDACRRLEMAAHLLVRCALVIEVEGRWSHLAEGVEPTYH